LVWTEDPLTSAHSLRLMTVQLLSYLRRVEPTCPQPLLPWLGRPDSHVALTDMFISGTPDFHTGYAHVLAIATLP
jgi:hypothetical protein